MGLFDRIGKIASGVGGAISAPFGLVKDLAVGAFTDDDEFDGFVGTVYGSITKRGGQFFGELMGPQEGLGAAIGALPGTVRTPIRTVTDPALRGLEYAGREFIREPLTAAVTATSLMQAGEGFDLGRGHQIAQTRSLGQAIALAVLTEDITDEAEITEAMGSDWYQAISGTFDAAARLFLEVDTAIGGGVAAARRAGVASRVTQGLAAVPGAAGLVEKGVLGRTIRTPKDVEAALAHPSLQVVNERIVGLKREAGVLEVADPDVLPIPVRVIEPAEAGPLPAEPGARSEVRRIGAEPKPAPAAEGMPPLFHGTPRPIEGGVLDTTGAFDKHARNLFGSGFYTTSSQDIAQSYVKKDARRAGAALNPTTYSVRWTGDAPPRVLDLETPNPPAEATGPFRQFINEDSYYTADMALDDIADVNRLLDEGAPLSEVYRRTKEALADAGIRSTEADELIQQLNYQISQSGFDALRYQGGKYAAKGQGEMHDVFIWLDPGKVEISKFERPKEPGPLHGPREPTITEVAPEPVARNEAAIDKAAARIRDLMFHDHRDGAIISRVLAEADDLPTAWGALMGHQPSIDALRAKRADVAGEISRLQGDQARIAYLKRSGLELPASVKTVERNQLDAELDSLYDLESRLAYNERANRMVTELPRISGTSERRANVVRSGFFQNSAFAAPMRWTVNMRPRQMVDLNDASGDIQVARLVRKAGLAVEEQDAFRGRYMAAADPTARNQILEEAQDASIRAMAAKYNITDPADIDAAIASARQLSTEARQELMTSRAYDGAGRSRIVKTDDAGTTHINVPLATTQEFNHFLIPNLDAVDSALKEMGEVSRRFNIPVAQLFSGTIKGTEEMLTAFQRVWKPSVLFRVGWPIRVVGEEQLRLMSQIGAMMSLGRTAIAGARFTKDLGADVIEHARQTLNHTPKAERVLRDPEAAARRGLRLGTMRYRGVEVESSFGTERTFQGQYRALNSARPTMEAMVSNADVTRGRLRQEVTGEWQTLNPDNPAWGGGWEHAVNNQMAKDDVWKQFLQGKSLDEVRDWIDGTAEGRAYLRRVPHWKNNIDEWLEFMQLTADEYLPFDELKALALDGKARKADIERLIPDAGARPVVHGAALADVGGQTKAAQWIARNIRDRGMRWLGTIPTDVLSRNNYFDFLYTNEIRRQIDLIADQGGDLSSEVLKGLEEKSRNYALGKSKQLLYDMGDDSELAHMLRFISPFYSAWQEVMTRWIGIAIENPAFVTRMHEVWRAPERMGIITDENGNQLNEDGSATVILTGEKVEAGKDRFVNFKLLATDNVTGKFLFNDLTRNIPGVKYAENARFNKKGANLILQGAPGVGPIVQIPLNEVAKGRPELEDSLKWALPFGATQSTLAMLMPATAKRAQTLTGGEEDRLYQNQLMRIYWDMQVDFNLSKRSDPPTYAEAKRKTDDFWRMRTVASFVSPVAPSFQSPYQMHIDAYRSLKEKDAETADEKFIQQFGEEFFPLTQSLSRTVDGVPPTIEGAAARRKYEDLIEKHPELGALIVGDEGTGEFSSAVYQSQLQNRLRPGSEEKQRKAFSFEEAKERPNERLGWIEFSKAMDLIDAERMNRGLPNLQVKGARDLADLKRNVIEGLARAYPEWYERFSVTDRNAWTKKMNGLREIAADDRLAGRDEIRGLRDYLEARDVILDELAARKEAGGASTLTAADNIDLHGLWENIKAQLVDSNDLFSRLYYRYLERDPVSLETAREVVV